MTAPGSPERAARALLLLLALCLFAFLVYPLLYVFREALLPSGRPSLAFFRLLFQNPALRNALINSLNLAGVVTLAAFLVSLPLAYALGRWNFFGRSWLQSLLLVPLILPPFVGALGMKQIFARFGSLNLLLLHLGWIHAPLEWFGQGFWAVAILDLLHLYPIMVLNLAASFARVDPSLEEAAQNLGASRGRVFRTVTLPLALPGVFAGGAIVFIWAFTDLGTPLMFEYREVAAVQIFSAVTDLHTNPTGYALTVLVLLLSTVLFWAGRSFLARDRYTAGGRLSASARPQPRRFSLALLWAGALLLTGLALLPHLGVVLLASSQRWFFTVVPEQFTSKYLLGIFSHPLTLSSIRTSLFLSALAAAADLILGFGLAYLLLRQRFRGKALLDLFAMLPLAVPGLVLAFGYVAAFSDTPLNPRVNPLPLLVIAYAIRRLPFAVRASSAGIQQIPPVLEEASANLGAKPLHTIRRITLPLAAGHLAAAAILCFALSMLEVSDSLILAMQEKYYPMTKAIYDLTGRISEGVPYASALGVLGMIILFSAFLLAGLAMGRRLGEMFRIG
jgi:iron(III) transport system permease protein